MKKSTIISISVGLAVIGVGFGAYMFMQKNKSTAVEPIKGQAVKDVEKPSPEPDPKEVVDPNPKPSPEYTKVFCEAKVDAKMGTMNLPSISSFRRVIRQQMIRQCMEQSS